MTTKRTERTRSAIIAAASEIFETRGFTATTLARIAEAAEVTKGALYYHFTSKQQIADEVRHLAEGTLTSMMDGARTAGREGSPVQALIDLTHDLILQLDRDPVLRAGFWLSEERFVTLGAAADSRDDLATQWSDLTADLLSRPAADAARGGCAEDEALQVARATALGTVLTALGLLFRRRLAAAGSVDLTSLWLLLLPGLVGPELAETYRPGGSGAGSVPRQGR